MVLKFVSPPETNGLSSLFTSGDLMVIGGGVLAIVLLFGVVSRTRRHRDSHDRSDGFGVHIDFDGGGD